MSGQFGTDDVEADIFNIGGDEPSLGSDRSAEDRAASAAIRGLVQPEQSDVQPPQADQPQGTQETPDQLIARLTRERDEIARQRDGIYNDLKRTRQQPQAQQPGQQKAPLADRLFTETEGALEEIQSTFGQQLAAIRLENNLDRANDRDPENFPKAFDAFMSQVGDPERPDPNTYFRIMNARDQGREIMAWYKEQSVLREVQDPQTFREKAIADHMASLGLNPDGSPLGIQPAGVQAPAAQAARGPDGKFAPRETRLPPSPGRMAGSATASRGEDGSDQAIWESGSKSRK